MILRLQSEQELQLLQSRMKAKARDVKVHLNEVQANRGTVTREEWLAAKNRPKSRQDHLGAHNKLKTASDKDYWAKLLYKQIHENKLPEPILELRFHEGRRWRFDVCWPYHKIAVEIEGAIWTQGRHTRGKGFLADMEKYNEAARLGWKVFRFTPNQVKTREALEYLKRVLD